MQFVRKGRGKFHSGDFTIVRPSGFSIARDSLELRHLAHDYNFRHGDNSEVWLLDGEREIGYAQGLQMRWDLIVGERPLQLEVLRAGGVHAAINEGGSLVSEVGGAGFPLKIVEMNRAAGFTEEEQTFVVAIALLAFRETDRAMGSGSDPGHSG